MPIEVNVNNRVNAPISLHHFFDRKETVHKETPDLNFIHSSFVIVLHWKIQTREFTDIFYVSKFTQTRILYE